MSMPIYLMFIRVLLSVEFCFTLKTYLKGAPFYNASATSLPGMTLLVLAGSFTGYTPYFEDRQNWFPSWSLNTAAVPQASVFGSLANSTPLLFSTREVAWTSSPQNLTGCGFPIWLSCPSTL